MLVDISIFVVPVRRSRETTLEVLLDDEIDLIPEESNSVMCMGTLSRSAHLSQNHDLVSW